jgi:SPP1 gp7 family putative phage head morphogenesis protein
MPQPLLTKSKAARIANSKRTVKGATLKNNAGVQNRYVDALNKLLEKMIALTHKSVFELYETDTAATHFGEDASITSKARKLNNYLGRVFDSLFNDVAPVLATRMVNGAERQSTSALHASLSDLSGGLSLRTSVVSGDIEELTKALIAYNTGLIKTIATDYLGGVFESVYRSITTGRGLEDLQPELNKHSDGARNKARNMALDQTRKAYNSINAAKAQKLGVKQFEWIHSGGGREPRKLHLELDGQIFSYDDLPVIDERTGERGLPGAAINCRCVQRPVITFND